MIPLYDKKTNKDSYNEQEVGSFGNITRLIGYHSAKLEDFDGENFSLTQLIHAKKNAEILFTQIQAYKKYNKNIGKEIFEPLQLSKIESLCKKVLKIKWGEGRRGGNE